VVRTEFEEPIAADPVDQPPGSGTSPSHDRFSQQLTTRNRGIVADDEQRRPRQATILGGVLALVPPARPLAEDQPSAVNGDRRAG
jgi:hypothetical protein